MAITTPHLGMTIERHIIAQQREHPEARGVFSGLLSQIALAGKIISSTVNKAGLADILGLTGRQNVQGEDVQKLDEFANSLFIRCVDHGGYLCVMGSEEVEGVIPIPERHPAGQYVLLFDPLDGSSNIDVNVSIGSIFSIYRKIKDGGRGSIEDCLQRGSEQVAAGYLIYGSSTMLVYSTGHGVDGFTLDPGIGEFLLSHEGIRVPPRGKIYSVNEGNADLWEEGVKHYIASLKKRDPERGKPYSARYIGSLVADFHRNLLKGGIFLYPADSRSPRGKLRLLYEANPLAFLIEQGGGAASDGHRRILDIEPEELHQRTPLIIGSREDVAEAEEFVQGRG